MIKQVKQSIVLSQGTPKVRRKHFENLNIGDCLNANAGQVQEQVLQAQKVSRQLEIYDLTISVLESLV